MPRSGSKRRLVEHYPRRAMDETPLEKLIEDFLFEQKIRQNAQHTQDYYKERLAQFLVWSKANGLATAQDLTTETMRRYQYHLQSTPSGLGKPRTRGGIRTIVSTMRTFCRYFEDQGIISVPVKFSMPPADKTLFPIFSDDELRLVFANRYLKGKGDQNVRNRAIVKLLLDSGLRISELCNLEEDDILFDSGATPMVRVRMGKGRKDRFVPFSDDCAIDLKAWLAIRDVANPRVFEIGDEGVRSLFRRIEGDLDNAFSIHPHKFRHTAATMMIRAKMPLESVKRILGHTDIATTVKYLSLSNDDICEHHAEASPLKLLQSRLEQRSRPVKKRRAIERPAFRSIAGGKKAS